MGRYHEKLENYKKSLPSSGSQYVNVDSLYDKAEQFLTQVPDYIDEVSLKDLLGKCYDGRYDSFTKEAARLVIGELILTGKIKVRMKDERIIFRDEVKESLDTMDQKLDSIKDDTEAIKEYASAIEDVLEKVDDLELFLKTKLASDFDKIKYAWEFYKEGRITRRELIIHGLKIFGKNLLKKII